MSDTAFTPFGSVTRTDGRSSVTFVQGESHELRDWSLRPGAIWPCSTLATLSKVEASLAPNGDLIDLETWDEDGNLVTAEELTGAELTAWLDDVIALAQ